MRSELWTQGHPWLGPRDSMDHADYDIGQGPISRLTHAQQGKWFLYPAFWYEAHKVLYPMPTVQQAYQILQWSKSHGGFSCQLRTSRAHKPYSNIRPRPLLHQGHKV